MGCGRDLLKGNTNSLLLCLLSKQPMYGYQIVKELEERSQGYFRFKEGTLYPALHRLEKAGLLEGRQEQLPNGHERRYYYITAKGREDMVRKVNEWQDFSRAVNLVVQRSET